MGYRSIADLNADVRRLGWELPQDIDLVVGVSRGGVLAVNLLRQTTGLATTALDNDGRVRPEEYDAGDTILLLTDVSTPEDAMDVRAELDDVDVRSGAVYVPECTHERPDYWVEVVDMSCTFEWDVLHPPLETACVDVDGVLCRDPTPEENDDGQRYREFLTSVEPTYVPDERIGWLVTCRLEQYRPETERWLADHGVEYDELVMWDLPSKAVRDEQGGHGEYKADVYESTGAETFIESSLSQAVVIARRTSKPVYCFDTNQVIPPGAAADEYGPERYLVRLAENPRSFLLAAGRHVASKGARTVGKTAELLR